MVIALIYRYYLPFVATGIVATDSIVKTPVCSFAYVCTEIFFYPVFVTENRVGPPSRPPAVAQQRRYQRLHLLTSSLTMVTNSTVIGGKDEGSVEPFRYVIDQRRLGM